MGSICVSGISDDVIDALVEKLQKEKGIKISKSAAVRIAVYAYVGMSEFDTTRDYNKREIGNRGEVGTNSPRQDETPDSEELLKIANAAIAELSEPAITVRLPSEGEQKELGIVSRNPSRQY